MKRSLLIVLLFSIAAIPVIYPYLQKGYLKTDDGVWAVVRLAEMHREVRDGQFPPRWSSYLNHGFGYPLFLFTYPLPFYIAEIFYLSGFGLVGAIKAVFIASAVLSGTAMFLLAREFWGDKGGVLSALLYLYVPYRLVNLYARGSIGESLAFVFFPLLLLFAQKILTQKSVIVFMLNSLLLALFILNHNASTVLFLPFLGIWYLYLLFKERSELKQKITRIVLSTILAFGLAASFWLPAVAEKHWLRLSIVPLTDKTLHVLTISEMLGIELHNSLSPYQIGRALLLGLVVSLVVCIFGAKNKMRNRFFYLFFGCGLLSLIFMHRVSLPFWHLPAFKEIDFMWRLFLVTSFFFSLCLGALLSWKKWGKLVAIFLAGLALIESQQFIKPDFFAATDDYFATNDATTTAADELRPIWIQEVPTNRIPLIPAQAHVVSSTLKKLQSQTIVMTIATDGSVELTLNHWFFPGWTAVINGQAAEIKTQEKSGLMQVALPQGNSELQLFFRRTPIRAIADSLTLLSGLVLVCIWIYSKKLRVY